MTIVSRRKFMLIFFVVSLFICVNAYADNIIHIKSGNASIGNLDPQVQVVGISLPNPGFNSGVILHQAYVVQTHSYWSENGINSNWVSTNSDGYGPTGGYKYYSNFTLPANTTNVIINVKFRADDLITPNINGVDYTDYVQVMGGPGGFDSQIPGSYTGDITNIVHEGLNEISFLVGNANIGNNPTGLQFEADISYSTSPMITGAPATSITAGTAYSFAPMATNATSFSITNKPAWASFDTTNGALTGFPSNANVGTYSNIVISATNSTGTVSLPAFSITVAPPMPTIFGMPATVDTVGLPYSFTPMATNATSFSITNKPAWASFDTTTGKLTGVTTSLDVGTYTGIVISAINSTGSVSLSAFSISVTAPEVGGGAIKSAQTRLLGMMYNSATSKNELRQINSDTGVTTLISGFNFDTGYWSTDTFSVNSNSNIAYAVSSGNTLYKFDLATGDVSAFPLDRGFQAVKTSPNGLLIGITYNFETLMNELRQINVDTGVSTLIASVKFDADYWSSSTFSIDTISKIAYAVSSGNTLYKFDLTTGGVSTSSLDRGFQAVKASANGLLIGITYNFAASTNELWQINVDTGVSTLIASVKFDTGGWSSSTFSIDTISRIAYAVSSGNTLYKFDLTTGGVTTSSLDRGFNATETWNNNPTPPAPVNGVCGSSNGGTFSSAPTNNLCSPGTPSTVTGTSAWNWICTGSNGGTTASCSATVAGGAPVNPGTDVTSTPSTTVSLTFNNITNGGTVSATQNISPPSAPANFRVITGSSYLISTTATFSGNIKVCLSYSDAALADKNNEDSIKLFHYNGQNWEDITTSVDTVSNIVCGTTSSLSPFIIVESTALVNGTCGTSAGVTFFVSPTKNLCTSGISSAVSGNGPWSWSCVGTNGGSMANCSASKAASPSTPIATTTRPTIDFSGYKSGNIFTIYRSTGGDSPVQIATGSSTSFTDTSTLKPNTIYQYTVTSDTDPTQTIIMTIRTPLYNGWNIVTVPYDTTNVAPSSVFASTVSSIYHWIPTGATPEANDAVLGSYNTVSTLIPGNGYFVKASNSSTLLTYSGNPGPTSATITLKPGWTMIANPNTSNKANIGTNWLIDGAPLSQAITRDKIGGGIYWWNGTTYDSWSIMNDNPQIEPWKGYWIVNIDSVNHTLTIQ